MGGPTVVQLLKGTTELGKLVGFVGGGYNGPQDCPVFLPSDFFFFFFFLILKLRLRGFSWSSSFETAGGDVQQTWALARNLNFEHGN